MASVATAIGSSATARHQRCHADGLGHSARRCRARSVASTRRMTLAVNPADVTGGVARSIPSTASAARSSAAQASQFPACARSSEVSASGPAASKRNRNGWQRPSSSPEP